MTRPRPGFPSLHPALAAAALAILALPAATSAAPQRRDATLPETRGWQMCSTKLAVTPFGRVQTGDDPSAEIRLVGGLWVGAEADRGQGVEPIVSEAAYAYEFTPVPGPHPHAFFTAVFTDTSTDVVAHEPLGLRVTQAVQSVSDPAFGSQVRVRWIVENISHLWRPPGWTLEHAYFGAFADPDVGSGAASEPWMDDQGAFASGPGGDLAYAFDEPGSADDTAERVGILLPGEAAHAFQVWSFGSDAADDAAKYALLRGDSHDVATIDPPTTRPNDYRMLLSVGPLELAPGESRTFWAAFVCGDDLGRDAGRAAAPDDPFASPAVTASEVRFAGLPSASRIGVYDVLGRRVAELAAPSGEARWELDRAGRAVPAGIYFYRVEGVVPGQTGKVVVRR
jgi:hypothetical protein